MPHLRNRLHTVLFVQSHSHCLIWRVSFTLSELHTLIHTLSFKWSHSCSLFQKKIHAKFNSILYPPFTSLIYHSCNSHSLIRPVVSFLVSETQAFVSFVSFFHRPSHPFTLKIAIFETQSRQKNTSNKFDRTP